MDHRSDIFSFGVVLFELLTGRPPFSRETAADTMAAILKEDPPELASTGISPALSRIVSRCLEKYREKRFQSARDLAFGLEFLSGEGSASTPAAPAAAAPAAGRLIRRRDLPWVVGGALLLGTTAEVVWKLVTADNQSHLKLPHVRLLNWDATQGQGEISPDGQFVAFLSNRDGKMDIFQIVIGSTEEPENLTADFPEELRPLPTPNPLLRNVGYTGKDPLQIWFSPREKRQIDESRDTEPKQLIPITSKSRMPLKEAFLGINTEAPFWSPDNKLIAYFKTQKDGDKKSGDNLRVVDTRGANDTQILEDQKEGMHNHNPVWSPKSDWIYFVRSEDPNELRSDDVSVKANIWRVRPTEKAKPVQLTDQSAAINYLAPIDDRRVLYTARDEDWTGPWLWELDVETKVRTPGANRLRSLHCRLRQR